MQRRGWWGGKTIEKYINDDRKIKWLDILPRLVQYLVLRSFILFTILFVAS